MNYRTTKENYSRGPPRQTSETIKTVVAGTLEGVLKIHTLPSLLRFEESIITYFADIDTTEYGLAYFSTAFVSAIGSVGAYAYIAQENPKYLLIPIATNFLSFIGLINE